MGSPLSSIPVGDVAGIGWGCGRVGGDVGGWDGARRVYGGGWMREAEGWMLGGRVLIN